MTNPFSTFLDELEARTRIADVLYRYCRGVDRQDWDLVLSVFHPDAFDDHGSVRGTPEELVKELRVRHAQAVEYSAHLVANPLIDFVSTTSASVETYLIGEQRLFRHDGDETVRVLAFARYVDRFEKRGTEWKIARRLVVYGDHFTLSQADSFALHEGFLAARRDGNDPLELQEQELGLRV